MFGYVRPFKGEMLVKEYDAYKGVYCQLCRALGKYYGFPAAENRYGTAGAGQTPLPATIHLSRSAELRNGNEN